MRSPTGICKKLLSLGKIFCYFIFLVNLVLFFVLSFFTPSDLFANTFFERHHLNLFLFTIAGGCLISNYKNIRFFRVLDWYVGLIIFLTCILLFIESLFYTNSITAFFHIFEKSSYLTIFCFILIGIALFDLSLSTISKRIAVIASCLIFVSVMGIILNLLQVSFMIALPIYSAVNFLLIAMALLFLSFEKDNYPQANTKTPKINQPV